MVLQITYQRMFIFTAKQVGLWILDNNKEFNRDLCTSLYHMLVYPERYGENAAIWKFISYSNDSLTVKLNFTVNEYTFILDQEEIQTLFNKIYPGVKNYVLDEFKFSENEIKFIAKENNDTKNDGTRTLPNSNSSRYAGELGFEG